MKEGNDAEAYGEQERLLLKWFRCPSEDPEAYGEQERLLLKWFRCPSEDPEDIERWKRDLKASLAYGCDWLAQFAELWNPIHAEAAERMAKKLEELEIAQRDLLEIIKERA